MLRALVGYSFGCNSEGIFKENELGEISTLNMHSIIHWGGASERKKVKEDERVSWIATWLSRRLHTLG